MQSAAVERLATSRNTTKLQEIYDQADETGRAQLAANIRKSSAGAAIMEKAPHLAGLGYNNLTAERLAKLDKQGAAGLVSHVQEQRRILSAPTLLIKMARALMPRPSNNLPLSQMLSVV